MEEYITRFMAYLTNLIEVIAAIIIGIASIQVLYHYILHLIGKKKSTKEDIRLKLGRSLAISLEFLLGADILKTVIEPTWNELGILAAIAVLRTGLNYFLAKELERNEKRTLDKQITSS